MQLPIVLCGRAYSVVIQRRFEKFERNNDR